MTQATGDARMERAVPAPHRVNARRTGAVAPNHRWAHTLRRFGRLAIWALPVYAVLAGLGALRRDPAFSTDPARFDHYIDDGRFTLAHLTYSAGAAFFGLLALIGITALLAGVRGRRLAAAGLICGLAGAAVLLPEVGTLILRQEAARRALLHGDLADLALNAQLRGGTGAVVVFVGALALTAGWILVGLAVWRSRVLQKSDGVLLIISAPLLYLGGLILHMLPVLGALLLLAAGIGLAFTAARLNPGGSATR